MKDNKTVNNSKIKQLDWKISEHIVDTKVNPAALKESFKIKNLVRKQEMKFRIATEEKEEKNKFLESTKKILKSTSQKLKIEDTFKKAKDFYYSNQEQIDSTYQFTSSVFENASMLLSDSKNPFNYLALATRTYSDYKDIFNKDEVDLGPFETWELVKDKGIDYTEIFFNSILKIFYKSNIIKENKSFKFFKIKTNYGSFGWMEPKEGHNPTDPLLFFKQRKDLDMEFKDIVYNLYWDNFDNKVIIEYSNNRFKSKKDLKEEDFIISKNTLSFVDYLKKYFDKGLSRSILLYGPPGTGKTNLLKGVVHSLSLKCVRIENFEHTNLLDLNCFLKLINPDCLVIDDIDHSPLRDIQFLLKSLEDINRNIKLILATVNRVGNLDDALIRPGRFDEMREILKLDDEILLKIVGNDLDIFERVKNFPVVCVTEIMKRVEALGKEEGLKSINDIEKRLLKMGKDNYSLE